MKFSFLHKTLSIVLVVIFIITGFILISNTQSIFADLEKQPDKSLTFKFIVLFVTGFSLFILNLLRPQKEVVIEKIVKQEKNVETKNEVDSEEEEKKIELLSEDEIAKQAEEIFPKETIDKLDVYIDKLLTNISKNVEIAQGIVFLRDENDDLFKVAGKYAYFSEEPPKDFAEGETLSGQVAKNQQLINIDDIPEGYVQVISGLGTGYPNHLLIVPAIHKNKTIGIIEIASFKLLDKNFENLIQNVANKLFEKTNKVTED